MDLYFKKEEILGANDLPKIKKNLGVDVLEEKIAKVETEIGTLPANYSAKNMLINWYFPHPVNRRGKTEYSGSTYSIDRWAISSSLTLKVEIDGCVLSSTGSSGISFLQRMKSDRLLGLNVTFSVLIKEYGLIFVTSTFPKNNPEVQTRIGYASDDFGGIAIYIFPNGKCQVNIFVNNGQSVKVIAAKLELGDQQTLAHQDEFGNWVLNEIPNYAEQYVICEQYSLTTDEFVGSQYSNQNIVDNWYWIGGGSQQGDGQFPINQGGKAEYTGSVYSFDRWKIWFGNTTIFLTDKGITAKGRPTIGTDGNFIVQYLENERFCPGTYTLSALSESGVDILQFYSKPSASKFITDNGNELLSFTFTISDGDLGAETRVGIVPKDGSAVMAIKLELGDHQTLAHQDESGNWVLNDPPPNYALELEKCQRYQIEINTSERYVGVLTGTGNVGTFFIPLNTPLRANVSPGIQFTIWVDGKTETVSATSLISTPLGVSVTFNTAVTYTSFAMFVARPLSNPTLLNANL